MALIGAVLWAVFVVTVVTSKPIDLNADEDSSKSLESSESSSSEEAGTNLGPSQSVLTETEKQVDPVDPSLLPSSDLRPSSATLDASALPYPVPEGPQTSTDTFQVLPEDPCQIASGVDAPQAGCNTGGLQDPLDAGTAMSPKGTEVTSRFQGVPQDVTPPLSLHVITPAPLSFSTDKPLTIPLTSTLTGAPVCFTIQLTTPEPPPARGDSI